MALMSRKRVRYGASPPRHGTAAATAADRHRGESCSTPRRRPASRVGNWQVESDATRRRRRKNSAIRMLGAPKITTASGQPAPASYFELTVLRRGGPRLSPLGARARQTATTAANDSVFVQFTGCVDAAAAPRRGASARRRRRRSISRTAAAAVVSGWGWQDNGYGSTTSLGQPIYFASTGPQTVRDAGARGRAARSIRSCCRTSTVSDGPSPGPLRNDTTILAEADGSGTPPPPPPPPPPPATPESRALCRRGDQRQRGGWRCEADASRRRRFEAPAPQCRRWPSCHDGLVPTRLHFFETDLQRRSRQGRTVSGSAARRNWEQLGKRLGVRAVLRQRSRKGSARHGASARPSAAEVNLEDCSGCGQSPAGDGRTTAGASATAWDRYVYFAAYRPADHPDPDARGRPLDRPDRAVGRRRI